MKTKLTAILFTDLAYYITSHLSMLQGNIHFCSLLAVPPSFCGVGSFLCTSSLGMTPSSFSLKVFNNVEIDGEKMASFLTIWM